MTDYIAEHNDDCSDVGDDVHEVIVKVTFSPDAAFGTGEQGGVDITFHNHNVSASSAACVLLLIAEKVVSDELAHTVFGECPSHELAHALAKGAAQAYLLDVVKRLSEIGGIGVAIEVPDDVSSLLDGDA